MADDRYTSAGKFYNRQRWEECCRELRTQLARSLDALWLSGDTFDDLVPMLSVFHRVIVPESEPTSYLAKKQYLAGQPMQATVIRLTRQPQGMLKTVQHCVKTKTSFDVINLDYCSSFTAEVESTLNIILRNHILRPGGLLFMTVANQSFTNKFHGRRGRTLARTIGRVDEQVRAETRMTDWSATPVAGYPKPYEGRGLTDKPCGMLSFGWTLAPVVKELSPRPALTEREKRILVRLRRIGAPPFMVAHAFEVTTGVVAAHVAHATRALRG